MTSQCLPMGAGIRKGHVAPQSPCRRTTQWVTRVSNRCIAVRTVTLPHRYGNSHATWDHTVLPATRQKWHSRPYPSRSWYSIKRPWRDARLSWPSWLVSCRDGIPVTHSSTNRARRGITSFMQWTPLTTTTCRQQVCRYMPKESVRCGVITCPMSHSGVSLLPGSGEGPVAERCEWSSAGSRWPTGRRRRCDWTRRSSPTRRTGTGPRRSYPLPVSHHHKHTHCRQAASQVSYTATDGGPPTSANHRRTPSIRCARPHGLELSAGRPPSTAGLRVL